MDRRVCDIFQHRIVRKQVKILEYQTVLAADLLHVLLIRMLTFPSAPVRAALFPKYTISPWSIVSSIVAQRRSVDLPEPDGPMMDTISPSLTLSEISFKTDRSPNDFST